jgi:hypothetical protein
MLAAAKAAIGDPQMAAMMERITIMDATLEDLGRAFLGCKSKQQATASGVTQVKIALRRLVEHYASRHQR